MLAGLIVRPASGCAKALNLRAHGRVVNRLLCCWVWVLLCANAFASDTYYFNLPAQPLADALQAVSEQTQTSALFPFDLVDNRTSKPVIGHMTVRQAVDLLLQGSGLAAEFPRTGVLVVSLATTETGETVMTNKKSLLAALIGLMSGGAAPELLAQTDAAPARKSAQLEEVIVTAQKREQSLQDVSAAVTAFGGEQLADAQINNIEDLQVMLPGLTFGNDFNFAKIFVRGVGMSSSFAGIDPSVALHVDGAVISQSAAQFTSLYDLERVEVVRGPQGTLYGRNATGGSINLITAKPTEETEGYARFTVGGDDLNLIGEGAISGPLSESVLGRLAVRYEKRDGFGTHTGTGKDIDDADKLGARAQLHFLINDQMDNLIAIEDYSEDENSRAVKFIRASFPDTTNPGLEAIGYPDVSVNSRNAGGDFVPEAELDTTTITNTFTAELSDTLTIRSITNWREFSNFLLQDFDVSDTVNGTLPPSATSTTQAQIIDTEQFSEELQFILDGERWRGIVGLYYFTEELESDIRIGRDPKGQPDLSRVIVEASLDVEAYAAFTNFTFDLSDSLALKVGARYSHEKREVNNLFAVAPPPAPGAIFDAPKSDDKSYSAVTPEIGLEYRTDNDLLLYVTYSEGFKSGTANLGERSPTLIDEETIDNLEIGLKGTLLDNTLQINLAGFYYEVDDAQFDRTFPIPVPPFFSARLENAAQTEGRGIELETHWVASDRLTIDMNATYYDIEFQEFESLDPLNEDLFGTSSTSVTAADLSGNVPRNTPEWTFNLHAAYDIPLNNGATLTLAGNWARKGQQYYTEFNNPVMGAPAYSIFNANILYTSQDERLSVNLWGKNLSDETVLSGSYAVATSRTITGTYLPPRQYGVTVGYHF